MLQLQKSAQDAFESKDFLSTIQEVALIDTYTYMASKPNTKYSKD